MKFLGLGLAFALLMEVTHAFAQPRTPPRTWSKALRLRRRE